MTAQEVAAHAADRQPAFSVIYAFQSPGSGAVYIGKHQCDPSGWPKKGTGRLPDGYRGSGRIICQIHRRHGNAVAWRILRIVNDGPAAVNDAERRAIRLARKIFGRLCVNKLDGGNGHTSQSAKAYLSTPSGLAHLAGIAQRLHSPEIVAKRNAALGERAKSAERQRQIAEARLMTKTPEALAKLAQTKKAYCATDAGRLATARRVLASHSPEARAKARESVRLFDASPEGKAKRKAAAAKGAETRAKNRIRSA